MIRIGVLVSGSGSNLQSIMDACGRGDIDGTVAVVISNTVIGAVGPTQIGFACHQPNGMLKQNVARTCGTGTKKLRRA